MTLSSVSGGKATERQAPHLGAFQHPDPQRSAARVHISDCSQSKSFYVPKDDLAEPGFVRFIHRDVCRASLEYQVFITIDHIRSYVFFRNFPRPPIGFTAILGATSALALRPARRDDYRAGPRAGSEANGSRCQRISMPSPRTSIRWTWVSRITRARSGGSLDQDKDKLASSGNTPRLRGWITNRIFDHLQYAADSFNNRQGRSVTICSISAAATRSPRCR
jgi:hypothetical protein